MPPTRFVRYFLAIFGAVSIFFFQGQGQGTRTKDEVAWFLIDDSISICIITSDWVSSNSNVEHMRKRASEYSEQCD